MTPGKNQKRYAAGARNARTKKLAGGTGERETSPWFMARIPKLGKEYRWARVIPGILDNGRGHDRKQRCRVLEPPGGKVPLPFLPPYSPDENKIERVWKDLHDNVTRDHRYRRIERLMGSIEAYLDHRNAVLRHFAHTGEAAE